MVRTHSQNVSMGLNIFKYFSQCNRPVTSVSPVPDWDSMISACALQGRCGKHWGKGRGESGQTWNDIEGKSERGDAIPHAQTSNGKAQGQGSDGKDGIHDGQPIGAHDRVDRGDPNASLAHGRPVPLRRVNQCRTRRPLARIAP